MKRNTSEKRCRVAKIQPSIAGCGRARARVVAGLDCSHARLQQEAVSAILKLQGTARYDWERKDGLN